MEFIIQLLAGAVGGNAAGAAGKSVSLGTAGNSIVGALGGLGGSQLSNAAWPYGTGMVRVIKSISKWLLQM